MLRHLRHAEGAPDQRQQPDHEAEAVATEHAHVATQLLTDDREVGERGVEEVVSQTRGCRASTYPSTVTNTRSSGNMARNAVVGDECGEVPATVVAVLLHDTDHEGRRAMRAAAIGRRAEHAVDQLHVHVVPDATFGQPPRRYSWWRSARASSTIDRWIAVAGLDHDLVQRAGPRERRLVVVAHRETAVAAEQSTVPPCWHTIGTGTVSTA